MIVPYEGLPASMIRQSDWRKGRRSNCERRNDCSGFRSTKSMPAKPSDGERCLQRAAAIQTPETLVSNVTRTLTLNDLQFLGSSPGVAYCRPGQGGFNSFAVVYGWESSHFLTVMDAQGLHEEVRRVLDYFLDNAARQPRTGGGHFHRGRMFSTVHPLDVWTGSILGIFAQHAICSRDWARFAATRHRCSRLRRFKASGPAPNS